MTDSPRGVVCGAAIAEVLPGAADRLATREPRERVAPGTCAPDEEVFGP
jgi:hypothetical protein